MKQLKIVKFYTTFRIAQLSFICRRWMSTHVTQLKTSSRNWLTRSVSRVWTDGPFSKQWSNLHQTTRPAITRVVAIIVKNRSRRLRSTFHSTVSSTMSYHRYNVFCKAQANIIRKPKRNTGSMIYCSNWRIQTKKD